MLRRDLGRTVVFVFILLIMLRIGASQEVSAQSNVLFSWHGTVASKDAPRSDIVLDFGIEDGYGAKITVNSSANVLLSIFDPSTWLKWSLEHVRAGGPVANYSGSKIDVTTWFQTGGGYNVIISNPNDLPVQVTVMGVRLGPPILTMDAVPWAVVYGEPVIVTGTITPAVSDGKVTLIATHQDLSKGSMFYLSSSVPRNGKYSLSWTPDAGKYELYVIWSGNANYPSAKTETVQLIVDQAEVKLMANAPSKIKLDPVVQSPSGITVTGRLDPRISGAPIIVSVENSNGLIQQLNTITDSDGQFTAFVLVDRPGPWHVNVQWAGDSNHIGVSQTIPIEAEINESYSQSTILALVVAAAFSNFLILKLRPRKNNGNVTPQVSYPFVLKEAVAPPVELKTLDEEPVRKSRQNGGKLNGGKVKKQRKNMLTQLSIVTDNTLSLLTGQPPGTLLSYTQLTKMLHQYIRSKGLRLKACLHCNAQIPGYATYCNNCGKTF